MTINQAAEKWNVDRKTVLDRVKIIPGAEKNSFRWIIPDNISIPPITSHNAYLLMALLTVFNEGGRPNLTRTGLRLSDIEPGYVYLTDMGYITGRPGQVTSFGKKLMRSLERRNLKTKGGVKVGPVYGEIEKDM